MILSYEMLDYPLRDIAVLRRVAARNDADSCYVLHLLARALQDLAKIKSELDELLESDHGPSDTEDGGEEFESRPRSSNEADPEKRSNRGNVGRPPFGSKPGEDEVAREIQEMWSNHMSLGAIARALNDRGIKTASGKHWRRQTVRNVIDRRSAEDPRTRR